jgi:hypothetical protein
MEESRRMSGGVDGVHRSLDFRGGVTRLIGELKTLDLIGFGDTRSIVSGNLSFRLTWEDSCFKAQDSRPAFFFGRKEKLAAVTGEIIVTEGLLSAWECVGVVGMADTCFPGFTGDGVSDLTASNGGLEECDNRCRGCGLSLAGLLFSKKEIFVGWWPCGSLIAG